MLAPGLLFLFGCMLRLQVLILCAVLFEASSAAAQVHASLRDGERSAMVEEVLRAPSVTANRETQESLRNFYNGTASGVPRLSRIDLQRMLRHWSMPDMRAIQTKREAQLKRLDEISKSRQAPVVKHIRGRSGVAFPEKQLPDVKSIVESPSYKAAINLQHKAMSKENLLAKFPAPKLPKCEGGSTIQLPLPNSAANAAKSSIVDLLYLNWEPPLDAAEIFGQRTFIHHFSTRPGDYMSALAGSLGVYCLPFRIRQTAHSVFWDLGLNALKNYDGDSDGGGEGVLHPYIKAKFDIPEG